MLLLVEVDLCFPLSYSISPWIHSHFKLVLPSDVRVLRAFYGHILKKFFGTRTSHARHTHVARTSHARPSARKLPVCAPQEKTCMNVFLLRALYDHRIEDSPHGARKERTRGTCASVLERLKGYVLCGAAAISKFEKCCGPIRPVVRLALS